MLDVGGERLYERVARLVSSEWNENGQCALVVGATFPDEISRVRTLTRDMPLLFWVSVPREETSK